FGLFLIPSNFVSSSPRTPTLSTYFTKKTKPPRLVSVSSVVPSFVILTLSLLFVSSICCSTSAGSLHKHLLPSVQSVVQLHQPSTIPSDSRSTVSPNE